jgi:hypothetical protein
MRLERKKLRNDFADQLDTASLRRHADLTPLQEQEWHALVDDMTQYIRFFAEELNGGEDDWTYWQKRYGPEILDHHLQRTAAEIEGFLDFQGCDPRLSRHIGEIMRIHDCGKADRTRFKLEDWVQEQRPDAALRNKRAEHTERGKVVFDEALSRRRSLEGNADFCALVYSILGEHHDLQSKNPLIRAIAIIDAYDGDTHHHWPHQGQQRTMEEEFRRLLGIDAYQKYAGKTDTDMVLKYAEYKGGKNLHEQFKGELEQARRNTGPRGPANIAASINR